MKELIPEIERRRASRALDDAAVPDEVVQRILTAGTYAPSCANNQPWRFLALRDEDLLQEVKEHLSDRNYWAKAAPLIVAVCTKPDFDCRRSEGREYAMFDTGMAVANMLLQGVREGLHTHPVAGFDPPAVKATLQIPTDVVLVALVVFGYPGDTNALSEKHQESEISGRTRKPSEDVVSRGRWPDSW
jgi:nitroreductase